LPSSAATALAVAAQEVESYGEYQLYQCDGRAAARRVVSMTNQWTVAAADGRRAAIIVHLPRLSVGISRFLLPSGSVHASTLISNSKTHWLA